MSSLSPPRPGFLKHPSHRRNGKILKRNRTPIACNECRERKRKCDGVRPVCGPCSNWNPVLKCLFHADKNETGKHAEDVASLRARVRELENILTSLQSSLPGSRQIDDTVVKSRQDCNANLQNQYVRFRDCAKIGTGAHSLPTDPFPTLARDYPTLKPATGAGEKSMSSDLTRPSSAEKDDSYNRQDSTPSSILQIVPVSSTLQPLELVTVAQSMSHATSELGAAKSSVQLEDSDDGRQLGSDDELTSIGFTEDRYDSPEGTILARKGFYVEPSSALGFMKHIQDLIGPIGRPPPDEKSRRASFHTMGYQPKFTEASSYSFPPQNYLIPPREKADSLLICYWDNVHVLYPYLYKAAFKTRYQKLWLSSQEQSAIVTDTIDRDNYSNDSVFFCILNMAFALALQYGPILPLPKRRHSAETFFCRAQKFITLDSLGQGDCALVQALLMIALYLQNTDISEACWNVTGLAIRVAQSIGLHLSPNIQNVPVSVVKLEIRRRVWTGCVLQDRVMSMVFGRPPMLTMASTRNLPLLQSVDEEALATFPQSAGVQLPNKPSYMTFWVQAMKLIQIAGDIIDAVYSQDREETTNGNSGYRDIYKERSYSSSRLAESIKAGDFEVFIKLDTALTQWHSDLPSFLKISSSLYAETNDEDDMGQVTDSLRKILTRQAKVLLVRYLHAKIFLYRTVLRVYSSQPRPTEQIQPTSTAMSTILKQSNIKEISEHCVLAARDLAAIISKNITSKDETLPTSGYNVFYLYTAATIFVAERLSPLFQEGKYSVWQDYWEMCLQGLYICGPQSTSAQKCFQVLSLVDKKLFQHNVHLGERQTFLSVAPLHGPKLQPTLLSPDSTDVNVQQHAESNAAPMETGIEVTGGPASQYPPLFNNYENEYVAQDMAWLENGLFGSDMDWNMDYLVDGWYDAFGNQ